MSTVAHQLRLMRDRRADNQTRLQMLELRLSQEAETATRLSTTLPTTFGRHASNWSDRHEAHYQRSLSEMRLDARNEIGSIVQKLARQSTAIAAFHLRQARKPSG